VKHVRLLFAFATACSLAVAPAAEAQAQRPSILVIWGDDVGWENVSASGMGVMGYTTPNLDRIGLEWIRFTDHYAQPSCTAGRAPAAGGELPEEVLADPDKWLKRQERAYTSPICYTP
jgi:hypothetical protein